MEVLNTCCTKKSMLCLVALSVVRPELWRRHPRFASAIVAVTISEISQRYFRSQKIAFPITGIELSFHETADVSLLFLCYALERYPLSIFHSATVLKSNSLLWNINPVDATCFLLLQLHSLQSCIIGFTLSPQVCSRTLQQQNDLGFHT